MREPLSEACVFHQYDKLLGSVSEAAQVKGKVNNVM